MSAWPSTCCWQASQLQADHLALVEGWCGQHTHQQVSGQACVDGRQASCRQIIWRSLKAGAASTFISKCLAKHVLLAGKPAVGRSIVDCEWLAAAGQVCRSQACRGRPSRQYCLKF